jgi:selenocysteine lyase/cysteine desulfurase
MKRKEFLQSVTGAFIAGRILPVGQSALPPMPSDPQHEEFWEFVRQQFPLTHDRAYLNTGGLGASPFAVIDAVKAKTDELEKICETGHSEELWREMKETFAQFFGADPGEFAFTRNTTEGVNIVANGLPFSRGDEIITTTHEHVGNALPWLVMQQRTGIKLKLFTPSSASPQENLDRIAALVTKRTRLISIPHATTTTGLIFPVQEIVAMARPKKIWVFVDGAQTAGMVPVKLHDLGCDAYATSGHKWLLGPKETGLLYVRKEMQEVIAPRFVGAYSGGEFDLEKGTYELEQTAQRYEYGTVSIPLRVGLHAAVRFLQHIGIEQVWRRDRFLADRLAEGLRALPSVEVLSPADDRMRSAMTTFRHRSLPYLEMQKRLDVLHLRTRGVGEGGVDGLRISTHLYNTPQEVDRVLEGVKAAG